MKNNFNVNELFKNIEKEVEGNTQLQIKTITYKAIEDYKSQGFKTKEEIIRLFQMGAIKYPIVLQTLPLISLYIDQYFEEHKC